MTKYLAIFCAISLVLLGIVVDRNVKLKQELKETKATITDYNKSMNTSTKVITEIREKIKYVKEDCDCYNRDIPVDIIARVHKNK